MAQKPNIITSTNIEIDLTLASLGDRILAYIVDVLIIGAYILFLVIVIIPLLQRSGIGSGVNEWIFFLFFLPVMFYSLMFEYFFQGQSPGKKTTNIKVVRLDGSSPRLGDYFLRWILRTIDFFFYGAVAMICIIIGKKGQRLGDMAAGTTVIKLRSKNFTAYEDYSNRIKVPENHQVSFPEARLLTDEQVNLIQKVLEVRKKSLQNEPMNKMAEKVKEVLNIQTDRNNLDFLYIILKDYFYLIGSDQ
ncbi:MAG: RDD family protein [Bacteroidota bacterium]